jgi:hypothetical protein
MLIECLSPTCEAMPRNFTFPPLFPAWSLGFFSGGLTLTIPGELTTAGDAPDKVPHLGTFFMFNFY